MNKKILVLLSVLTIVAVAHAQNDHPIAYWSFDTHNPYEDTEHGMLLQPANKACSPKLVTGLIGHAIDLGSNSCMLLAGLVPKKAPAAFSMELLFKGKNFYFLTGSQPFLRIRILFPKLIFLTSSVDAQGKTVNDELNVRLEGTGRESFSYLNDGRWHHLVFVVDPKRGRKEIWIDGILPKSLTKAIPNLPLAMKYGKDGFMQTDEMDELAVYGRSLSPKEIRSHYLNTKSGMGYFDNRKPPSPVVTAFEADLKDEAKPAILDVSEFAPGYPDYTVQATEQLKHFPLPRFARGASMLPNFPWTSIDYLHRELPQAGGKGFGKANPWRAVELTDEMARNWNYYIELLCLRQDSVSSNKQYGNTQSVAGALLEYANQNPQFPTATIMLESQVKPVHAGMNRKTNFVLAQDLADHYYLQNKDGRPAVFLKRKWLSPLYATELARKDALVARYYLKQMLSYLKRPLNIINENGEVFGHMRPPELLMSDPKVAADIRRTGFSIPVYNGWFQYRMDSVYKETILQLPGLHNTWFTFYNVSAINPEYWPDYGIRRRSNTEMDGNLLSTPDFYPRYPWNWREGAGAWNGYGAIAYGRKTELALGQKFFSPYISAGWGAEEKNIRPAQWLGLLKAMTMLGAEFFYTGYFNETGAGGKWPNGVGPYDPRGYIYQVAMPVYAQALASRFRAFVARGSLLGDTSARVRGDLYRLPTGVENQLVMGRRLNHDYLLMGTVQPNSNYKNNTASQATAHFILNGRKINLPIRRQGSTYFLHMQKDEPIVVKQLDAWHEFAHPYYWSSDFCFEAECADNIPINNIQQIHTEILPGDTLNLTRFDTYYQFILPSDVLEFDFQPRQPGPYYCFVRARCRQKRGSLSASIQKRQAANSGQAMPMQANWTWYKLELPTEGSFMPFRVNANTKYTLAINGSKGVEVDKVLLSGKDSIPQNDNN